MKQPNPQTISEFPRSIALHQCLQGFTEQMQAQSALQDGVTTARVVGEFSSGKTRFLRELFGDLIPEPLFPISSLERQTRLQLEITYGETPELILIDRAEDYSPATTIKTLSSFPARQELLEFDPAQYRLRLAVNEPHLILRDGDGYGEDKSPKRLFLIDTPGWNSGDDALAEREASAILTGYHNLALIYISQAARLDGSLNAEHLKDFLDALSNAEFLDDTRAKLIFVVTHCPSEEADKFKRRAHDLVLKIWQELGNEASKLNLDVYCVDFQELSPTLLQAFRTSFWHSLLGPLKSKEPVGDPWAMSLRRWPETWDIRPQLAATDRLLNQARTLLEKTRQGDEFVVGMNMYRLMGLSQDDLRRKVLNTWLKQLGCEPADLNNLGVPDLAEGHPLSDWWASYWQANARRALEPVQVFFRQAQQAIGALTVDVKDLNDHLLHQLAHPHAQALQSLENSFTCLVKTAQELQAESAAEKRLATLFTLSLLQARYEDYYEQHAAVLALPAA